jgi:hypothetical protein
MFICDAGYGGDWENCKGFEYDGSEVDEETYGVNFGPIKSGTISVIGADLAQGHDLTGNVRYGGKHD